MPVVLVVVVVVKVTVVVLVVIGAVDVVVVIAYSQVSAVANGKRNYGVWTHFITRLALEFFVYIFSSL